jgi:hypothetical protein
MSFFKRWKIKRITKKIQAMQATRATSQPSDIILKKEIAYYMQLAALYKTLQGKKKFPYANLQAIECYRQAANLNDAASHLYLGKYWLEEAKFRLQIHQGGVFVSNSNLRQYTWQFEEALAHLVAAEKLGSSVAKRLRGLCLINGWGLTADKEAGFELVVDSIEQEGSWDKVPQLFAEIGLNKPEFFAALMQRKKQAR